ncbi:hypothetical protein F4778DRAFT_751719 [Xylariomycetidae sp. FL2044]|nr:hypothetical protein F4778DRAFT_751719 [Xylariomycetidae sp. FL2044]
MAPQYDDAPEVAHPIYPEVHHPPPIPEVTPQYGGQNAYTHTPSTPMKPSEDASTLQAGYTPVAPSAPSTYGTYDRAYDGQSTLGAGTTAGRAGKSGGKRLCGCSILVFILSLIIALLSAAVIGLAAGTGAEASRANDAESKLARLSASGSGASATVTVTAPSSTATDASTLDKGCSADSAGVTGTTYTSQFLNKATFKIYCNSDTPNTPLLSLFVGNFDDCLDACGFYSNYLPGDFNSESNNATCAGVSFIPAWTNRTFALEGGAPGNCYLKPGPQNRTALGNPNIGSSVHAAILQTES